MADTVYGYPEEQHGFRGEISFTRFWRDGEDWVQITLVSEDPNDAYVHTFASMPFKNFAEAFQATADNVSETSKAWWHSLKNNPVEEQNPKSQLPPKGSDLSGCVSDSTKEE